MDLAKHVGTSNGNRGLSRIAATRSPAFERVSSVRLVPSRQSSTDTLDLLSPFRYPVAFAMNTADGRILTIRRIDSARHSLQAAANLGLGPTSQMSVAGHPDFTSVVSFQRWDSAIR